MLRTLILSSALALVFGGTAVAQDHAPAGPSAAGPDGKVIGPHPNEALPIGGFLKAPPGSTRLVAKKYEPAEGLPLYVIDRPHCRSQCAVLFPPLTPAAGATPPSKDWTIIVRDESDHPQWAYKGKPIYTFIQDKTDVHPQADNVLPEVKLARP